MTCNLFCKSILQKQLWNIINACYISCSAPVAKTSEIVFLSWGVSSAWLKLFNFFNSALTKYHISWTPLKIDRLLTSYSLLGPVGLLTEPNESCNVSRSFSLTLSFTFPDWILFNIHWSSWFLSFNTVNSDMAWESLECKSLLESLGVVFDSGLVNNIKAIIQNRNSTTAALAIILFELRAVIIFEMVGIGKEDDSLN